jgi:hypothetical protein
LELQGDFDMAFGKRTAGEGPAARPAPEAAAPDFASEPTPLGPVRTRIANHGDMDNKFIGLAIGVVVLSGGAAIAAPSLFSIVSGNSVRPIEQVIAGLDRAGMEQALASEAFPDESGRAFMTSLAANFPDQHGRLVDRLADAAAAGQDRDGLLLAMNAWSAEFATKQMPAISRTGAEGFDRAVSILSDGLRVVESKANGCTPAALQDIMLDPDAFDSFTTYGSEGYRLSMRAGQSLVDLAAKGRTAQPISTTLTQNDMSALQATFFSLMMDEQVLSLVQTAGMAERAGPDLDFATLDINVCQLGRTVLIKLDSLPADTKSRLWATLTSGEAAAMLDSSGFSSPFGPQSLPMGALTFR